MRFLPLAALPLLLAASPPGKPPEVPPGHAKEMAAGRELFTKSVRKTLLDHCFKCHGAGPKLRGGLDIATRDLLLKGGDNGPAIIPGKSATSRMHRLSAHLDEPFMPPKGNDPLGKQQRADLAKWIDLGAPYDKPLDGRKEAVKPKTFVVTAEDRDFWSFRPLVKPPIPAVKAGWDNNPIDRFLLAAMEKKGLTPSPRADRRTVARRLYLGLTGLPPTPEEMAAALADGRPDAHARLVDRLLASPATGEKWARHWLDVARFAESHGFEHDYDRPHAWPYRDFVIKALNADLPYRDFARWQIAGDEIAPDDPLALTATGFLGAGVHSTQITANTVEKERYDELDDIVRTAGTAFLGITLGCARCHDHKYDPIGSREYYRLVSTFTKTVRSEQDIDLDPVAAKAARERHASEVKRLESELAKLEQGPVKTRMHEWMKKGARTPWLVLPLKAKSAGGAVFVTQPDGSSLATGKSAPNDTYTLTVTAPPGLLAAIRLEALAHPSLVKGGPGRAPNGNFALSDLKATLADKPLKLANARATFEQKGLPVAAVIDADPRSAWAVDPQFGKDHAAVFDLAEPVEVAAAGAELVLTLRFNNNTQHSIGRPRVSVTGDTKAPATAGEGIPPAVRAALSVKGEFSEKEAAVVLAWYRTQDAAWRKQNDGLEALKRKGPDVGKVKAMICSEGVPAVRLHTQGGDYLEQTHYLLRGDSNQKDGVATQAFPEVLVRRPEAVKKWRPVPTSRTPGTRRAMADWLVDVEDGAGHLLARVMVNRLWQHHFGRGIVATPSDFGTQGERPTHPELLDWLAGELISSGWSLKHIHRLILTSAAWQQASADDAAKNAIDSENRFLWRRVPRRLEAESVRDSLLAVSGQLDRRMGGAGTLDVNMKRRSVYFFLKRSQLNPMMTLFDAPDGTVGIESRTTTTIAPQALLLMNSPVVREASRKFAARLAGMADEDAVRSGYEMAVGRLPSADELKETAAFLKEQRREYADEKKPAPEALALADFCQVLLGLNEFLYVD